MSFVTLKAARQNKPSFASSSKPSNVTIAATAAEKAVTSTQSSVPDNLEIRTNEKEGRGLWAKFNVVPGEIIIHTTPKVAALSTTCLSDYCSFCFLPSAKQRCSTCQSIYYCSPMCQKNDWKAHKPECTTPSSSEHAPTSDATRALARIVRAKSDWMKDMQCHRPATDTHIHLSRSLISLLGAASPEELSSAYGLNGVPDVLDLVSRFTTNAFTVTTPDLTPIGVCVSPLVALFNHSCAPNAVVVFPNGGLSMQVIAVQQIQAGEQVLTSYIDTTVPKSIRRKELRETYHFECNCTRCEAESEQEPESEIVEVGIEALKKVTKTQDIKLTSRIIPMLLQKGLKASSHPLLALSRLHQSLLLDAPQPWSQSHLDEAIQCMARSVAGQRELLAAGHPMLGVALAELGKMLAVDEPNPTNTSHSFPPSGLPCLQLAKETLLRALESLQVGFGKKNEGGEVGRDVRETILRIESEIDALRQGVRDVRQYG